MPAIVLASFISYIRLVDPIYLGYYLAVTPSTVLFIMISNSDSTNISAILGLVSIQGRLGRVGGSHCNYPDARLSHYLLHACRGDLD